MKPTKKENSVLLSILVKPRAKRDEIVAWEEGMIVVHVKAPPKEGEANEGCRRLLADVFRMPISKVTLVKGESSRIKKVQILGISKCYVEQLRERWLLQKINAKED